MNEVLWALGMPCRVMSERGEFYLATDMGRHKFESGVLVINRADMALGPVDLVPVQEDHRADWKRHARGYGVKVGFTVV